MDVISFSEASTANGRIETFNANPDSTSGVLTVPKVIASGETITIPTGRVAVLPNVQVDGVLNVQGEVFVPSGNTYGNRMMYEKISYVATQGQTTFSVNYDLGSVDVYVNGIRLASTDFVATSLTTVVITGGVNAGDLVELVSLGAFSVANTYTKAEADNLLGFKANTADLKEIGVGQTWQDLTASRVIGTTYTNSTGKPIFVSINCYTGGAPTAYIYVNSIVANSVYVNATYNNNFELQAIVPNGSTYKLISPSTTIIIWSELR